MSTTLNGAVLAEKANASLLYRAVWRWHFYAGLYVIPFLLMLAITGLIMIYGNSIETPFGIKYHIDATAPHKPLVEQAAAAAAAVPGGKVTMYLAPRTVERSNRFMVSANGQQTVVSVDPTNATIMGSIVKDQTWYYWADHIHGTLLLGDLGDRLIEIAAGFGLVLVITGLYMWWPRDKATVRGVFFPRLATKGRLLWKELHVSIGFWLSIILVFFLISGMSWTGVWGKKYVQAWSSFPAEKWDNVPLSDKTHASMNHGALHEVPWALEETPLPASGSQSGVTGIAESQTVNLDSIAALAQKIGFHNQFRINLPDGETGVYTISADSMDHDTDKPWQDRTVHIDQYTGKILAQVNFADYSLFGKSMAVGIALHQGDLGLWNILLNTLFCLSIIFLCLSGIVMWWKRRPKGEARLVPPVISETIPHWPAAVLTLLALGLAFPLLGLAVIVILALDALLISRVPRLKHIFK